MTRPCCAEKWLFTVAAGQFVNSAKISDDCPPARLVKNNNYKFVTALASRSLRLSNVRHDTDTSRALIRFIRALSPERVTAGNCEVENYEILGASQN